MKRIIASLFILLPSLAKDKAIKSPHSRTCSYSNMKTSLSACLLFVTKLVCAQYNPTADIRFQASYSSENIEVRDILQFEGVEYLKLKFTGESLKNKKYTLTVREIWDGKLRSESIVLNTADAPTKQLSLVNDSVLNIKVISRLTAKNKLRMTFKFPSFATTREYDAVESDDYSLRVIPKDDGTALIDPDKKFYLLAYILPYEKDGFKYWCAVEDSGMDIENWGKDFGIKHYLVFQMQFQ